MSSSERKISVVPPRGREPASDVEMRLAGLEAEAERLRLELAALDDDLRWLTEEDEEWSGDPAFISHGLLARGWVRASLLLVVVGFVALVSVPYLLHQLDPSRWSGEPDPALASSVTTARPTRTITPAALKATPDGPVPAPVRVRASAIPDPVRLQAEEHGPAVREPRAGTDASRRDGDPRAAATATVRDASP